MKIYKFINLVKTFSCLAAFTKHNFKKIGLTHKINYLNKNVPMSKKKARPILLKLQKNKCLMCNNNFSKYIPHEIHHIDHNSKNNTLLNFAALCPNCHMSHHRHNIPFPMKKHKNLFNFYKNTQ